MGERNLVLTGPGALEIREERPAPLREGTFRVATVYSGVSAGTELSYLKGSNPYLRSGWNATLGLFEPDASPATPYPVTRLGYMEVGRVTESRTPSVDENALVAMTYGHRTGYLGDPLVDRVVPLPDDLDPLLGIYAAHMGPICANGLLHAAADLCGVQARDLGDGVRGRRVVVTGAGIVALLTALFARRHGAASVVVADASAQRRALARAFGLETLDPDAGDAVANLKARWRHAADDRGADVVFQCRGQASVLHFALRLLRPQGTVVDLAFYQGGADALRLGEEFHHNGLTVRCAQIGRVPRGLAPTWDRERLSAATIDLLRADGTALREHLAPTVVKFDDAPAVLADLAARRRSDPQIVLAC